MSSGDVAAPGVSSGDVEVASGHASGAGASSGAVIVRAGGCAGGACGGVTLRGGDATATADNGEHALQQPHHRFWAQAAHEDFPPPPPAVMSGGPNTNHSDPVSLAKLQNCPSEKCFIDDIGSWSTNEITINWNSPFAWVVAYLDEQTNPELAEDQSWYCEEKSAVNLLWFLVLLPLLYGYRRQPN